MPKRRMKRHAVTQPLDPSYRFIPLTQGLNAIVDTSDFEWLSQWNWSAKKCGNDTYAVRRDGDHPVHMHQQIAQTMPNQRCDHANHNTIDNRRSNLRKATPSQSACNRRKHKQNKSGFKGVSWDNSKNKWQVNIGLNGTTTKVGRFRTTQEAARAYDQAAKNIHGSFALLNFP